MVANKYNNVACTAQGRAHGYHYYSYFQEGILYVDDTNLWVGLNQNSILEDAVYEAQEAVNFWGNSLIATGGALNPEKCK